MPQNHYADEWILVGMSSQNSLIVRGGDCPCTTIAATFWTCSRTQMPGAPRAVPSPRILERERI